MDTSRFAPILLLLTLALVAEPVRADTAILSNGTGDGSVTLTVGPYGSFGEILQDEVLYDPVGPLLPAGVVFASALFFGPAGQFLTTDTLEFGAGLPDIAFDMKAANTATSTFPVAGFTIQLTQTLGARSPEGSALIQTYSIRNDGKAPSAVTVLRYFDGDLEFDSLFDDSAGVTSDGAVAFEFDTGDNPSAPTTFVGIANTGGTLAGYSIQPYPFSDAILAAGGIPARALNVVSGDANGDRLTDTSYDVTLSLQHSLVIPPQQAVQFITSTIFGAAVPQALLTCETDEDCGSPGNCLTARCDLGECIAEPLPNDAPCDDDSVCTENDRCADGLCAGEAVSCDDGNDCTGDLCDPALGCFSTNHPDGFVCNDGNNCLLDSCQAALCVESSSCLAVEVPEVQTVRAAGGKAQIKTTCIGRPGDTCTAQGFVPLAQLLRSDRHSASAADRLDNTVRTAASTRKCNKKKLAAKAKADAAGQREAEITKSVTRKIKKKGKAKLKLKLNRVGKCLLDEASENGLAVTLEASVDSSDGGSGTLQYIVRLVKKSKNKKK